MKIKQLLFLGFLFLVGFLNAQTDFRAGYIINSNNDTINGEIDYRTDLIMGKICRFKNKESEDEIMYSPSDIMAYKFNDSRYFVSKDINGKNVFLEYLIKGKISIYYLDDKTGFRYFLEKDDNQIVELPYEEGIRYKNDMPYFYKSTKHMRILGNYMQDAQGFESKIVSIERPNHKDLIELVEDYNKTVCKDSSSITYKRQSPVNSFNIDIIGGLTYYQKSDEMNDIISPQAGILTHIWLPMLNEKLYIRTGLLFSAIKENNNKKSIYKIPIQLEYEGPGANVRPVFAYGINIICSNKDLLFQSLALMAGLKFKLNDSLSFRISYDIDCNPNKYVAFIPSNVFSHSLFASLQIKL